jgi:hypothetical protein
MIWPVNKTRQFTLATSKLTFTGKANVHKPEWTTTVPMRRFGWLQSLQAWLEYLVESLEADGMVVVVD